MQTVHVADGGHQQDMPGTTEHSHKRSASRNVDVHGEHTGHHGTHGLGFDSPDQVQSKHQAFVKWVGRLGWVGKGIVYAIIGGLCIHSAHDADSSETPQGASVSPQGAFILLAANPVGAPLLIILAACLAAYIVWRFAEAATGQGYDAEYSRAKNFFRFRLSPFVSGIVYCAYLVFILSILAKMAQGQDFEGSDNSDFTTSWRQSGVGKFGLCILGIAFLAAFLVQLDWVVRGQWHTDYRSDMPRWAKHCVFAAGHLGCLGRGAVFLAVSVLFFKEVANTYQPNTPGGQQETTIANALSQLRGNDAMRGVLWVMGLLLIVYGGFAVVSSWARVFPTPPPSRRPKVRDGAAPVVYEVQGNTLGPAHPMAAPEGAAAAAQALHDMENGTAAKAEDTKDMLVDAQKGHAVPNGGQAWRLRADAAFWRKAGKAANIK